MILLKTTHHPRRENPQKIRGLKGHNGGPFWKGIEPRSGLALIFFIFFFASIDVFFIFFLKITQWVVFFLLVLTCLCLFYFFKTMFA